MNKRLSNTLLLGAFAAACISCGGDDAGMAGGELGNGDGHYDGAFMVFVGTDNSNSDIYAVDADGDLVTLAANAANEREPALSPDGSLVVYSSRQSGTYDLWLKSASNPGAVAIQLTSGADSDEFPTWSPDGARIAFTRRTDQGTILEIERIWRVNVDGTGLLQLTMGEAYDPKYSPDGLSIYYGSFDGTTGSSDIWVMNADGSVQTPLTLTPGRNDYLPIISGTKILFLSEPLGNAGRNEIMSCDLDGSNVQDFTQGNAPDVDFPAVSPDGTLYDTEAGAIWFYRPNSNIRSIYLDPLFLNRTIVFSDGSLKGG